MIFFLIFTKKERKIGADFQLETSYETASFFFFFLGKNMKRLVVTVSEGGWK